MISSVVLLTTLVAVCVSAPANPADTQKEVVKSLARQLMLQQLAFEERIRSEGDSGLKQTRHQSSGTRPYYSNTYVGAKVAAIHDHANNIRTVGLGEFAAVLNGVEFRTRHNDYGLRMPSTTSSAWGAHEDIPFPDVPPAVLSKATIKEQIEEMREWFKAWKNQDFSKRNYRKYFKPNLCYLEGAWTLATDKLEESFESDRHFIDASSWFDLQEKVRYTAFSGRKSGNENFAYLPTKLWSISDEGIPQYAQWNYRILCQPLKDDVPLNRIRMVNDFGARMAHGNSAIRHASSRAARFQLNPFGKEWGSEGRITQGYLDSLMSQVPGKDNAKANLVDVAMGDPAYALKGDDSKPLNAGYYHRWFKSFKKGAMGLKSRHRGYADENMWAALTTQPKVAPMGIETCTGRGKARTCRTDMQRWTYAIPLELIYLTPLNSWNPYNLEYKGAFSKNSQAIKPIFKGNNGTIRNGRLTPELAYNGIYSKLYLITPDEFYSGKELEKDKADTTRAGAYGVLDRKGNMRAVRATGTRVFLPNIPGVGVLRTRYPIMPVHVEGNPIWKELEALKDVVMDLGKYSYMLTKPPVFSGQVMNATADGTISLEVPVTIRDPPGEHTHLVDLSPDQVKSLKSYKKVSVTSTLDNGHAHALELGWNRRRGYYIYRCDRSRTCWDGHGTSLKVVAK